ncbi:MAG: M3 family oligoendopeptidase [Peptoniphilaceae bacterium]|nr:M3 family oligoendopeptidase [Peptoniphilaceae bacterium]MDY6019205.1 M3 family oligoendopeptidase [Anaerococcus sp.]
MKFKDLQYQRPDFDELIKQINELLDKLEKAPSEDIFFDTYKEIENKFNQYYEMREIAYIRNSINTEDEFYDKQMQAFYEISPSFDQMEHRLQTIRLNTVYRPSFEDKFGKMITARDQLKKDVFNPSIMEDRVKEAKLVNEYNKLTGGARIEFRGEVKNISGMSALTQDKDRQTRKEASEALNAWFYDNVEELDRIYDQLIKVRTKIANKLGFKTYTKVAYKLMDRVDWDIEDARRYRKQILDVVVPFTQKLYKEQKERIGVEDLKYYDLGLNFLSGNPKPIGGEDILVKEASKMYHELSDQTDEFFKAMVEKEMMDLTTKHGKAPGGYMTYLPVSKMPYIFSNFNGTSGDVDVLTHEAGHAFQGYLTKDVFPSDNNKMTSEIAETHSMSMEFFTHPWMKNFFGKDTEKYYYYHVVDAIEFLPYGVSIDEFQEEIYENPDMTPQERRAKYRQIEKKYLPHLDYDGNEYLESGGRWQRQLHVYNYPFYYLDYTIAQINAFQYFVWDLNNHQDAWNSYLNLCKISGKLSTKEALKEVGLESPFEEGTIAKIIPKLQEYLDSLDKEKIK